MAAATASSRVAAVERARQAATKEEAWLPERCQGNEFEIEPCVWRPLKPSSVSFA